MYYASALAAADEGGSGLSAVDKAALRSDLTQLLVKLRKFDEAKALIQTALADNAVASAAGGKVDDESGGVPGAPDVLPPRYARKNLQLLAKVLKGTGQVAAAGDALEQALAVQNRVLGIVRRDPTAGTAGVDMASAWARMSTLSPAPSVLDVERIEAAVLCMALGYHFERDAVPPNDERARAYYHEASRFAEDIRDGVVGTTAADAAPAVAAGGAGGGGGGGGAAAAAAAASAPAAVVAAVPSTYEAALLALARLHLRRGEIDDCRGVCTQITKVNPVCEEASVMLADLLFRQNDTPAATFHFSALLERKPNAYEALARLTLLLKRAGRLADVQRFMKQALRAVPSADVNDAGYRFCKGMYAAYNNEPHEAIKVLNTVRTTGTCSRAFHRAHVQYHPISYTHHHNHFTVQAPGACKRRS